MRFARLSCVRHPVSILYEVMNQLFDSTDERYSICHLTGQVRSVIVKRTFIPLHIRYIFVLSVIHPLLIRQSTLVDRSLSITCPLNMRYSSPDDHRINIFCIFFCQFGVSYPYTVICDSTIIIIRQNQLCKYSCTLFSVEQLRNS